MAKERMRAPPKLKWAILLLGDMSVFYLALWLMLALRYGYPIPPLLWDQHILPFVFLSFLWLGVLYMFGLYDLSISKNTMSFWATFLKALGFYALAATAFFYFLPFLGIAPKTNLFLHLFFILVLFLLWRRLFNVFVRKQFLSQNLVIVGDNAQTRELYTFMRENPQMGYNVVAIINPTEEEFTGISSATPLHVVVLAIQLQKYPEFMQHLFDNLSLFAFQDFSSFYEEITGKIPLSQTNEMWFLDNFKENDKQVYEALKRFGDIIASLFLVLLLILFSPLIALAIKLDTAGPIFYSQERVGKNGTLFRLWKFRSMIQDAENGRAQWSRRNDPRITRVGKVLRKTFLDELPQCLNILKGDMSFIGPRPERSEFVAQLAKDIPFYHIRHIVKPGVTGWAQVNYPYGNSTQDALEKLQYEMYYLKNRSFVLDLKILLRTIPTILRGGTQWERTSR